MAKAKTKNKIISKIVDIFSGKNSVKRSKKSVEDSPAHSPGHKKLKNKFSLSSFAKIQNKSQAATNKLTRSAVVARTESQQRRIISGASLNKKGRLV